MTFDDNLITTLGGKFPPIWRPCGGKFIFIGECYLHSFMDGEGLIEARTSIDPDFPTGDTTWLRELHKGVIPFRSSVFILK